MPENRGFYQKYHVTRVDGKPIDGRTFTLEFDTDPLAFPALKAYRDAASANGAYDELVDALDQILEELEG